MDPPSPTKSNTDGPSADRDHNDGQYTVYGGQINVHKSTASVSSLMAHLQGLMHTDSQSRQNTNSPPLQAHGFVLGVQEPPVYKGRIRGFTGPCQLFHHPGDETRAAVFVSSSLTAWSVPEFTSPDLATCCIQVSSKQDVLYFASAYNQETSSS